MDDLDRPAREHCLDTGGVATTPPVLTAAECAGMVATVDDDTRLRSTVHMATHSRLAYHGVPTLPRRRLPRRPATVLLAGLREPRRRAPPPSPGRSDR